MKRVLVLSDSHAGALLGLTPPQYWRPAGPVREYQETLWTWFTGALDPAGYDYCLHAGDVVEGEGKKDATFHLTTNIREQIQIAIQSLSAVKADKFIFCSGTPYHTSGAMDYEHEIAQAFGDHSVSWMRRIDIDGVKINLAHTIGKTSTPTGGDIMLRKALLWDQIAAEANGTEKADIIIRGHIHESRVIMHEGRSVITCPALKIGNPDYDKYARRMSGGYYSVGIQEIEIYGAGEYQIKTPKIAKFTTGEGAYDRI